MQAICNIRLWFTIFGQFFMKQSANKILFFVFLAFAPGFALAQINFKLKGTVYLDSLAYPGATITVAETGQKTITDSLGKYDFYLKPGKYKLQITAVGAYATLSRIWLKADTTLNFFLFANTKTLSEVKVNAKTQQRNLQSPQMGAEKLSMKTVGNIPLIFGERDVLKAIQLLPGIKSAGEGSAGFYVRGGAADQNLILMDEVPVYNASHLLGFFSTFNPDAVEDITIYKTGMPAQFGGRLSSVLDIKMKPPEAEHIKVSGGIGLISSKLTLQGPIKKEKANFLVSARRTYIDALLRLSPDSSINQNTLYFYDVNGKIDINLGAKDKLTLNGYLGRDKFGLSDVFGLTWGNVLGSAQYNHFFSDKLSSYTNASYSNYNSRLAISTELNNFNLFSQIADLSLRQTFLWLPSTRQTIRFGLSSIYHNVKPGEIKATGQTSLNPTFYQRRYSLENALFANSEWELARLTISAGLRLSGFSLFGPGSFLLTDDNGQIVNTLTYNRGQYIKTYLNLEPRLSLSYLLNSQSSIKASYVRNTQNLHMASNSTSTLPTDKWLSSTLMIKPELADQYAIGYYKDLANKQFELSIESYYKTLKNQIDYRDGADVFNADAIETQLLYGNGRAYGLEFLFRKKLGNLTGWLSYTISKTERKINGINNGNWYNARQDRTHDIAITGNYQLGKKWSISASWVYYTGDAITFPEGKYTIDQQPFFYYTQRNGYRMPAYHRLDLGATLQLKQKKRYSSSLSFSLYNAYGRNNAYAINFRASETQPGATEVVQTTLFKLLPAISYNFNFL